MGLLFFGPVSIILCMLPEDLLWKYIGLDRAGELRLPLLGSCEFKITQPCDLNDPFEVKPFVLIDQYSAEDWVIARRRARESGMFMKEPSDDNVERLFLSTIPARRFDEKSSPTLWPARIPELREEPFQTIAEVDEFRARKLRDKVEQLLNETIGIFSMTEDPEQLVMWTHYAAEHRGIAVGFDRAHPSFQSAGLLARVEYADSRIPISSVGGFIRVAGHEFKEGKPLPVETLLRKHPAWDYEREWRLIVPLSRATATESEADGITIYLFRFQEEAIRALIVGARVTREKAIEIRQRLSATGRWTHLRVLHAQLSNERFTLEFEEVPTV